MKSTIDAAFEFKDVTDSGAFVGLGSVFGNIDGGDDIVLPGAFAESLQNATKNGRMPAMLWQHRQAEPIGAWQSMVEKSDGLEVSGRLALKTQRGAEAYELMKMRALSGLSIGGRTKDADYNAKSGVRTIKSFELFEVSPVTFPMNDLARIASVKSIDEFDDATSVEDYLRDAGGLSRREAKAVISSIKAMVLRDASPGQSDELSAIASLLERRSALMT